MFSVIIIIQTVDVLMLLETEHAPSSASFDIPTTSFGLFSEHFHPWFLTVISKYVVAVDKSKNVLISSGLLVILLHFVSGKGAVECN